MISFTKRNKDQGSADNGYGAADSYTGYSDYGSDYVSSDFGEEVGDETAAYTEPGVVDQRPEEDLSKSSIKLMKFTSPAEREKVAECLKDGCAVIFELTDIDRADWFRVIDYIQGAIFMIGGTISRFSEYSLVAAPKNFDVSKLELDDAVEAEEEEEEVEEAEEPEEDEDEI